MVWVMSALLFPCLLACLSDKKKKTNTTCGNCNTKTFMPTNGAKFHNGKKPSGPQTHMETHLHPDWLCYSMKTLQQQQCSTFPTGQNASHPDTESHRYWTPIQRQHQQPCNSCDGQEGSSSRTLKLHPHWQWQQSHSFFVEVKRMLSHQHRNRACTGTPRLPANNNLAPFIKVKGVTGWLSG